MPAGATPWDLETTVKYGKGIENGMLTSVGVVPKPLQKPYPPVFLPFASSPNSIRWAAREGVTAILPPMHEVYEAPLFDLMLLGLGADGHTASLLPGQTVLEEKTRWVAPVPKGRDEVRLTLTYPALESSRVTLFMVAGADKARAVRRVRAGDTTLPAGALRPTGEVVWLLDRAAAGDKAFPMSR